MGTKVFLLLCIAYVSIAVDYVYHAVDHLSINCGSSNNVSEYSENWIGDNNIERKDEPSSSVAAPSPPSTYEARYKSARLSHSQFTYSFPVTSPGPKFLRLFFLSTSYLNFDRSKAYFSVKSGGYTLLQDFNASVNADYDSPGDGRFFREYIITIEAGQRRLNITFTPSPTATKDSYAFINGIQIVSMPSYLYYTKPDDMGLPFVGSGNTNYHVENTYALQTMYRLRGGVKGIPPASDTGMYRDWESDNDYLTSQSAQSSEFTNNTILNFKYTDNYTAPDELYQNVRNMGFNGTHNMEFNLTWQLPVDSNFTYLLRLHFCELDPNAKARGYRRFKIFIADQMVTDWVDVLLWTQDQKGVPVVKNYVVSMSAGNQNNQNLSVKLHPYPKSRIPDVLLNGIELFKINDSRGNLAGPNPPPKTSGMVPLLQHSDKKKKISTITALLIAGAVSAVVLLSLIVAFFVFKRGKNVAGTDKSRNGTSRGGGSSSIPTNLCRYFTMAEIRSATNDFDEVLLVGVGGFGNVYKGYIDDGSTPVAIKRLKAGSQQGFNEFLNEIEMLSKLRHRHLVSLIGYCNDGAEMILVYDFMQRGTLREYLYDSDNPPLSWNQRLQIVLGAARGLHYLHEGANHSIIHRDVKSTNILVDEKWVAKVSDFGLSKVGPTGTSTTHVSTIVKGSLGYLDPEYYKRQRLTLKSDVYSFGVVLLEVLCVRPPLIRTVDKQKASLVDWVRKCYDGGEIDRTVDPFLKNSITAECLKCYVEMALNCLLDDGNQRPSMNDVVGVLEFALQLVESEVPDKFGGTQKEGNVSKKPLLLLPQFMSDEEGSGVRFTSSDDSGSNSKTSKASSVSVGAGELLNSTGVFSEIANPRAR